MPYVQRQHNEIIAVFNTPSEVATEHLALDNPELLAFLGGVDSSDMAALNFIRSDLQMARVLEDLIGLLMEKNIIAITDFPLEVIHKLKKRHGVRQQFSVFDRVFGPEDQWD